jgi:hypothetical protein
MVTYHFTRAGLLEPFRRTLMCLQLRHSIFPGLDCDFLSVSQDCALAHARVVVAKSVFLTLKTQKALFLSLRHGQPTRRHGCLESCDRSLLDARRTNTYEKRDSDLASRTVEAQTKYNQPSGRKARNA